MPIRPTHLLLAIAIPAALAAATRHQHLELRAVPATPSPAIDGRFDDWDHSGSILLCADVERDRQRRSARAMAMYDATALYLGFAVRDPTPLRNPVMPDDEAPGWRDDCVQIRLRLADDGQDDRILFLDAWQHAPSGRVALRLYPDPPGDGYRDLMARGATAAFRRHGEDAGYDQELRIPWDALGLAEPAAGTVIGMGLEVVGGERGGAEHAFRLTDLVARHGTQTASFFAHPERWGRLRLMPHGDLPPTEPLIMPVPIAEHPFLICRREDFPGLRRRAEREPWRGMREDALERVASGPPEPGDAVALQFHLAACALAAILEPESARAHAERVRDGLVEGLAAIDFDPAQKHRGTVPPMGAAFLGILALDVVHAELSAEEIAACEDVIARQIARIDRHGAWPAARLGTHGTWDIYRGERILPDDDFHAVYLRQMSADGVTTVSPGYAFARLGSGVDRPQKTGYADVLEFTGIDRRYYDEPKLERFYRWLFAHSVTPAKDYHLFGDVAPTWRHPNSPLLWRVGRFDRQAAAHAAWLLAGRRPPGHLLSYVLMEEPLPDPAVPRSALYPQGGAFLRQPADDPLGLAAALYTVVGAMDWHAHEEVNAISLAAHGNRLLVNGGWLGEDMRPPWKNNTIAIDGQRHAARSGGGLAEGFTSAGFDYACGDAGAALGSAAFQRSLVFVHPIAGADGYVVTLDEVEAEPGQRIHHYLHPATGSDIAVLEARRAYRARIDHHAEREGVRLTVLYPTRPESVTQDTVESGFLERSPSAGHHRRLEAIVPTRADGRRDLLTVLLPGHAARPGPVHVFLEGPDHEGLVLDHGEGIVDLVLRGTGHLAERALAFDAALAWCRGHPDPAGRAWFVRRGRHLRHGAIGFESTRPVSVLLRGRHGHVAAREEALELTIHHPGITALHLGDRACEVVERSDDRLRVILPAGDAAPIAITTTAGR